MPANGYKFTHEGIWILFDPDDAEYLATLYGSGDSAYDEINSAVEEWRTLYDPAERMSE